MNLIELLPHKFEMLLIEEIIKISESSISCLLNLNKLFLIDPNLNISVGIECIAQAGALIQINNSIKNFPASSYGMISNVKNFFAFKDLKLNAKSFVAVELSEQFDNFCIFNGKLFQDDICIMSAELTVVLIK